MTGSKLRCFTLVPVLFLGCLLVIACQQAESQEEHFTNPEELSRALEQAGADVAFQDESGPPVLGLTPVSVWVNGELLLVYTTINEIEPAEVRTAFAGSRHVWAHPYLIVQYEGNDGVVVLLLDGILGEALLHPQSPGDEPYPPAVPVAIRAIADEWNTSPTEIEVLDYVMTEWPDSCLGLGGDGEGCTEAHVTGWQITLGLEGQSIEVRTDTLGDVIRIVQP